LIFLNVETFGEIFYIYLLQLDEIGLDQYWNGQGFAE